MVLTPAERRGAAMLVLLLALGAGHDLWRARGPVPRPAAEAGDDAGGVGDTTPPRGAAGLRTAAGPAPGDAGAAGAPPLPAPRLDLNRADARALDALPGVGPVLAARIVEQRRRYGRFHEIGDLLAVRGVGPRLFERLAPRVEVEPATRDSAAACSLHAAAVSAPQISHQARPPGDR